MCEDFRRRLTNWRDGSSGIAALSFTNVASEEIEKTLGYRPSHPHFIGTLDSFVYRFISRPFARLYDAAIPPLELLPAEVANLLSEHQRWTTSKLNVRLGPAQHQRENIFRTYFVGERDGEPVLSAKRDIWSAPEELPADLCRLILAQKQATWRTGRVSHSDAAFIAAEVLRLHGKVVRDLLLTRFPILIVDEAQDTGWFLNRILENLLADKRCVALVVGDPDQAIYEFNGARPALFKRFMAIEGARPLPLHTSQRLPSAICAVAAHLAASDSTLKPTDDRKGRATLGVYDDEDDLRDLVYALRVKHPQAEIVIVARSNSAVDRVRGKLASKPTFSNKPLESLHDAVFALRRGNMRDAFARAQAALAIPLFDADAPGESDLEDKNLSHIDWRLAVSRLVFLANEEVKGESLVEWGNRMKNALTTMYSEPPFSGLPLERGTALKKLKQSLEGVARGTLLPKLGDLATSRPIVASTVHAVKGQTHSITLLFSPPPRRGNKCVSQAWWSSEVGDEEEKRIAYVAATRPRHWFILLVDKGSAERLVSNRPAFCSDFEVRSVKDLIAEAPQALEN